MAQLTNGERKIQLSALVADLERARREAKNLGCELLAFLIGYAEEEGQRENQRCDPVRAVTEGSHANA